MRRIHARSCSYISLVPEQVSNFTQNFINFIIHKIIKIPKKWIFRKK
jgi:hypothetical protein